MTKLMNSKQIFMVVAILATLSAVVVVTPVLAQNMTGGNATAAGNMTGGNATAADAATTDDDGDDGDDEEEGDDEEDGDDEEEGGNN